MGCLGHVSELEQNAFHGHSMRGGSKKRPPRNPIRGANNAPPFLRQGSATRARGTQESQKCRCAGRPTSRHDPSTPRPYAPQIGAKEKVRSLRSG